jgi:large subunit ribosomal protein L31
MREGIHPEYKAAKILCACGSEIVTRSTAGDFHIEICSSCHPFFTGKQKIMDTAGRIERFKNRYAAQPAEKAAPKKVQASESPKAEKKAAAPSENRAAKRAKAGKSKKSEPQAAKAEAVQTEAAADEKSAE